MPRRPGWAVIAATVTTFLCWAHGYGQDAGPAKVLPGTGALVDEGDLASRMIDGIDRFLLAETAAAPERRRLLWRPETSTAAAYQQSLAPYRERLSRVLGVRDQRVPFDALELVGTTARGPLVGKGNGFDILAVRWPAVGHLHGEGLLLSPHGAAVATVIALPDAGQTPEMLVGLGDGVPAESQYARRLAESGCRVVVPMLIDRATTADKMSRREYLYRPAYIHGRHLLGYEIQKVLALVDLYDRQRLPGAADTAAIHAPIGVMGWGEGGFVALAAAALDGRIDAACVSGFFGTRDDTWREPADRNVFGLLERTGDAELAAMVAPRTLVIEAAGAPEFEFPVGLNGAPGRITTAALSDVRKKAEEASRLTAGMPKPWQAKVVESGGGSGPFGSSPALSAFLTAMSRDAAVPPAISDAGQRPAPHRGAGVPPAALNAGQRPAPLDERLARQVNEIERYHEWLLAESGPVRATFFSKLDTSSLAAFAKTVEPYRQYFYDSVIGRFDRPLQSPNARTRLFHSGPAWAGYEVLLDVFPDVVAYGLLLVPKGLSGGQRRPVVVCQHGLEGRPQDLLDTTHRAYHGYAVRLVEQGYVVFAPQNPYLFKDRFRALQRKANPLGKTLFSIIVPQHQQIVDWLETLPFVDPAKIAFYGLSYGGKTAMRVPPLVKEYCLSICSGDFNEWVDKNASTRARYSYVRKGEYEIFEFDLANTFNYAEMAALICPRPFMVERGHFDGVGVDEMVAHEYAKVRFLYEARLGIGERTEIEWFNGPHEIHGVGSFEFLRRNLRW